MNTNHSSQNPSDVESRSRRATSAASRIAPLALTRNLLLALLLLTQLFTWVPRIAAQTVPPLINYQGRLSNPDGSPLPTADYTLTFNIYDAPTNGTLVWGPQVFDGAVAAGHGARTPVVQGYFNVMLGPGDTVTRSLSEAFNGTARYVEVTVSNRPPILPRQQILTTPFAFQAANSAKLAGYDWSVVFGTNNPVAGTIPFSKLAQRPVGTNVGIGGVALSPSSGLFQSTLASYIDVSNFTLQITTSGRPVLITLTPDLGGDNGGSPNGYVSLSSSGSADFLLLRNSVATTKTWLQGAAAAAPLSVPGSSIVFLDNPPAGTYTYSLQVRGGTGFITTVRGLRLTAYEL